MSCCTPPCRSGPLCPDVPNRRTGRVGLRVASPPCLHGSSKCAATPNRQGREVSHTLGGSNERFESTRAVAGRGRRRRRGCRALRRNPRRRRRLPRRCRRTSRCRRGTRSSSSATPSACRSTVATRRRRLRLALPRAERRPVRRPRQILTTHFGGPRGRRGTAAPSSAGGPGVNVDSTAIDWLRLSAASTIEGGDGDRLTGTTYIQRVATTGGLTPPAADCNRGHRWHGRRGPVHGGLLLLEGDRGLRARR